MTRNDGVLSGNTLRAERGRAKYRSTDARLVSLVGAEDGTKSWQKRSRTARRVLILRPDHFGDVVLFSGTLRHLRRAYPDAKLTLCTKRSVRNIVDLCPWVDDLIDWEDLCQVLPVEVRGSMLGLPAPKGVERLLRETMRRLRRRLAASDIILVPVRSPVGGTRGTYGVVSQIPSSIRIGIAGDLVNQTREDDLAAGDLYTARLPLNEVDRFRNELDITTQFLRFIGIPATREDVWPETWTDERDRRFAARHVQRGGGHLVAICPGTDSRLKRYPLESWVAAFSRLSLRNMDIVLLGAASETDMCRQLQGLLRVLPNVRQLLDLSGRTTLRQLAEVLRLVDLVAGPDTGAIHLAIALGRRTVCVLGGGLADRFLPWGDPAINRVLTEKLECCGCGWVCPRLSPECVERVVPERVAAEIEIALSVGGVATVGGMPSSTNRGA